jgi:hypothetical protein
MATQAGCPVCSSEDVYSLLNTLHCKRCGNIWKEEKNTRSGFEKCEFKTAPRKPVRLRTIPDNAERRMEQTLEVHLKKFKGKFSLCKITWTIGDIQMAMFRRYLKKCVRKGTLLEDKDRYGIVWYSRPD